MLKSLFLHPSVFFISLWTILAVSHGDNYNKCAGFSDEMQQLVLIAVEDLRKSLKDLGSDLMIRFGSAENVILDLVKEVDTC